MNGIYDFTPYSDIEIKDKEVVLEHNQKVNSMEYQHATAMSYSMNTPFCARIFNQIEQKIRQLQIALLNKQANPDEFYSLTEPTAEQMDGKRYWIKPL